MMGYSFLWRVQTAHFAVAPWTDEVFLVVMLCLVVYGSYCERQRREKLK